MCGFLFWLLQSESEVPLLKILSTKVKPRGPDETREYIGSAGGLDVYMCFHRLAIVHLDPKGMQPFWNGKDNVLMAIGEIWNESDLVKKLAPPELRSDVDIITYLPDLSNLGILDADFSFVSIRAGVVYAGRDYPGVRPMFYATDSAGEIIGFASEAKALAGGPRAHKVSVFPPGCSWNSQTKQFHNWFNLLPPIEPIGIRPRLETAVVKRIDHSERPVGLLCSGGIDSALITMITSKLKGTKFQVFTMQYAGSHSEDAFYATLLCSTSGFDHQIVQFTQPEVEKAISDVIRTCETYDPNTIRASIPMYLLARYIAEKTDIKVILSGEGADELFAGYLYFNKAPGGKAINEETRRLLDNLHMFDLLRADRCFAHFGLEIRVPFLDSELIREVLAMDGTHKKFRGGEEKALLRSAFEDYDPRLESCRILHRTKEKFSDGTGGSYVPQLLNLVSHSAPALDLKLAAERDYYTKIFETEYPGSKHWIIERAMPDWAGSKVQNVMLN